MSRDEVMPSETPRPEVPLQTVPVLTSYAAVHREDSRNEAKPGEGAPGP